MAANVSVDSTAERVDSYMYSVEIIILTLKEPMTIFFKDIIAERITPTVVTGKSSLK